MSEDRDPQQEYAHMLDLQQQDEQEAREALAFASAVATVASYLQARSQIPEARMTKILFTLADWPDNPPAQSGHH